MSTDETKATGVSTTPELARVAMRVPPFWEQDADLWFLHLESQFHVAGITADLTMFHSVVSALDAKVLAYVREIVANPPEVEAYKTLKEKILGQFSKSEFFRLRQLLLELQLGDNRPSELLVQMRNLSAGKVDDSLLTSLWLQRLPLQMQQILSLSKDSLDNLAAIADKMHEISNTGPSQIESVQAQVDPLESLRQQVEQLTNTVSKLSSDLHSSRQQRNSGSQSYRQRPRSRSRSRNRARALCWYHSRFDDKARKCIPPCSFQGNGTNPS